MKYHTPVISIPIVIPSSLHLVSKSTIGSTKPTLLGMIAKTTEESNINGEM